MNFGETVLTLRKNLGLKQIEVAKQVGVQKNTISNYENNVSKPQYEQLVKLCNLLKCDPNTLMTEDVEYLSSKLSIKNQQIIESYNKLNESDKRIVDFILEIGEYDSAKMIMFPEPESSAKNVYVCPQKASAGIGKIKDESNPDLKVICFEDEIVPPGTTHGIIIDGHSMEDKFFDKQIVFIQNGLECAPSDYGIFSVTNDHLETNIYCKQLMQRDNGYKYLHSVNKSEGDPDIDYQNVINVHCIGRILR